MTGILYFIVGYLFGSVPFGLLITKFSGAGDIRSIGSGNIGATNVLRTGNKALAAATLIGDGLKGAVPIWLFTSGDTMAAVAIALGAFLGHLFPVWLKFKGGKGVATFAGLLLPFSLVAFGGFALIWLLVAAIWRYSSMASLAATLATPTILIYFADPTAAILFAILAALAWFMHRENIKRLLSGAESKIGSKE